MKAQPGRCTAVSALMPMSSATSPRHRPAALPLLALAIGAFGIGTTEFGPMGMLPTIADGVGVSIPTAGLLVSAYAIGVTLGAPVTTLLLARWPRRTALIALMAVFVAGNLASAAAPGYTSLLLARVLTSLSHGAFFGLGALMAASLVPPGRQASAIATMFLGLTVANIGGVPVATWLGQVIGWREAFAAIALLGVLAMLALRWALPVGERGAAPDVRSEVLELLQPQVLAGIATTVLGAAAMFTLYTYINPVLQTLAGGSPTQVTGLLVLVGIGFTVGNSIGGALADRSLERALLGIFTAQIAVMLLFPSLATSIAGAAVMLLLWGAAAFATIPPLQMWVMRAAAGAPGLASSVNVGAFNLGNALGAALGGLVLKLGLGHAAVPVAGALLATSALLLVFGSARSLRRQQRVGVCEGG